MVVCNCNCFTARAVCGVATVVVPRGVRLSVPGVRVTAGVRLAGVCGGRLGVRTGCSVVVASELASCFNYD